MSKRPTSYGSLKIDVSREGARCQVTLTLKLPGQSALDSVRGPTKIDDGFLISLLEYQDDPDRYGQELSHALLRHDPKVYAQFVTAKNWVSADEDRRRLRIQLAVHDEAPSGESIRSSLHQVRWELLSDPQIESSPQRLSTSKIFLLSRFVDASSGKKFKIDPSKPLQALIAVSAPSDAKQPVDAEGEITRAKTALAGAPSVWAAARKRLPRFLGGNPGIRIQTAGDEHPLTLDALSKVLDRTRPEILYLVCHGGFGRAGSQLLMQDEQGKGRWTPGAEFANVMTEAGGPTLVVLASCHSAASEQIGGADATVEALAPLLVDRGVPAIVAMQGNITMKSVEKAMPVFFEKLLAEGQIDYAIGEARNAIRNRDDAWMPALFTRLEDGRLWAAPERSRATSKFAKFAYASAATITVSTVSAILWFGRDSPQCLHGKTERPAGVPAPATVSITRIRGERAIFPHSCGEAVGCEIPPEGIVNSDAKTGKFVIGVCAADADAVEVVADFDGIESRPQNCHFTEDDCVVVGPETDQ